MRIFNQNNLNYIFYSILAALCAGWGCTTRPLKVEPRIGDIIEADSIQKYSFVMSSSSDFCKVFAISSNNIIFDVGVNSRNQVQYISTTDTAFKTQAGFGIGDSINKIPHFSLDTIIKEEGWAYYLELPSGWNAAFVIGSTMTEGSPLGDEKIMWFFKRGI